MEAKRTTPDESTIIFDPDESLLVYWALLDRVIQAAIEGNEQLSSEDPRLEVFQNLSLNHNPNGSSQMNLAPLAMEAVAETLYVSRFEEDSDDVRGRIEKLADDLYTQADKMFATKDDIGSIGEISSLPRDL